MWKTEIGDSRKGMTVVRGYELTELIGNISFSQAIFLVLTTRMPSEKEDALFNAILVSSIEHGLGAPSTQIARTVASTGNAMNAALAAGLLAQGKYHGGAVEECMRTLLKEETGMQIVADATARNAILSGFGHKVYTTDPRTQRLFTLAQEHGYHGKYVERALQIETALEQAKGKKLCINVDGAIAALLCELGFSPELSNGIFAISRISGLVAHITEERKEKPYRRLSEDEYEYVGPMGKKL
jgi:citrate synthase